jgi:hypothetical protein
MSYIWAGIVSAIILLVIYGIVSSRIRDRRVRRLARELLPEVDDHIKADRTYKLVLTSGTVFDNVRFLGVSRSEDGNAQYLPFPLQNWLVLEQVGGKRLFVGPSTVKYYEEV